MKQLKVQGTMLGCAVFKERRLKRMFFSMIGAMAVIAVPLVSHAAGTMEEFVGGLKRGHVNLEVLVALQSLDKSEDRVGYGLCMVAKRQDCAPEGSFGYGLCMAAGRSGCVENGSLGYGLCMAGKRSGCEPQAGLGYGLCMAANRTQCAEKF